MSKSRGSILSNFNYVSVLLMTIFTSEYQCHEIILMHTESQSYFYFLYVSVCMCLYSILYLYSLETSYIYILWQMHMSLCYYFKIYCIYYTLIIFNCQIKSQFNN